MADPKDPIAAGLPHRPPFLFVDQLLEHRPGELAVAQVAFSGREAFFQGHFPDQPMVPGVLLTEALAQTAGLAISPPPESRLFLTAVRSMKFPRPSTPPVEIRLTARVVGNTGLLFQCEVEAEVDGQTVASGVLVLTQSDPSPSPSKTKEEPAE